MIKIVDVVPCNNYCLKCTFSDSSSKILDLDPFMKDKHSIFYNLYDIHLFNNVYFDDNSIYWNLNDKFHSIDLSKDTIVALGK